MDHGIKHSMVAAALAVLASALGVLHGVTCLLTTT
jgi:hypothetical protein